MQNKMLINDDTYSLEFFTNLPLDSKIVQDLLQGQRQGKENLKIVSF